ncbi:hypothetical protein [Burkholderia pseudomallei]
MIASPRGQRVLRVMATVGAAAIATLVILDHVRLVHLTRTSPNYASYDDVRALQRRLERVDTTLTRLQHAPAAVTQTTFDTTRKTFDARLSKLEERSAATASTDAVNALDARVHQLETHPSAAAQAASKAAASTHRRAVAPVAQVPPFVLLGEEQRGGQTFLVVAPSHWQAMDDVHLLQPGDSEGHWQLEALDADTATFRIDDRIQRLPVR